MKDERLHRLHQRLDRLEAQYERSVEAAADDRRTIAELRSNLKRLRRPPLDRLVQALRRRRAAFGRRGNPPEAAAGPGSPGSPSPALDAGAPPREPDRIAIHIAALDARQGATWGDTSFAAALARAFEQRGWVASIHSRDEWDSTEAARAEVALHLLGLRVPPVRPGQVSLLWVISHPDMLTARRCETYDAVFVASESFRDDLADRIETPVHALLQATDPERFFPDPSGPHHELLFVGSAKPEGRPIVEALAGTTHDLAVYGHRWTPDLLDGRHLRGEWIPNERLNRYYSSADIVLNDTWRDMREEGFIPNRVFDALASGSFVVSDRVVGIDGALDGSVATFERADELPSIIDRALADPDERRARAQRGRAAVLERHTFGHRADAILAVIDGLRSGADPATVGIEGR